MPSQLPDSPSEALSDALRDTSPGGLPAASRMLKILRPWLDRWRFLKFGLVGASGTVVNMLVLFASQEYLFAFIAAPELRLNISLAVAIFCATINNFTWNRTWTWSDRDADFGATRLVQFAKYAAACWLGISIQFVVTKLLSAQMHYLLANLTGIVIASVFNYLLNDSWTFEGLRLRRKSKAAAMVKDNTQ